MYTLNCIMHRSPPPYHQFFYLLKYFEIHSQFYFNFFLAPSWIHNYWAKYLSHFSKLSFIENTYSILESSRKSYVDFHEQNNSVAIFFFWFVLFCFSVIVFENPANYEGDSSYPSFSQWSHVLENFAYCTKGEVTLIFLHWQWLAIF